MNNLHDHRKSYEKNELTLAGVDPNPMQQFHTWFHEVKDDAGLDEPNAMTLTTAGKGFPRGRVVLLKKYDEYGFYFYTNYGSEKGIAISENNKVCLSFFWPSLERQIIIQGIAEKTSEENSTNYFHSRPKGSQLGALVSDQSQPIESRELLQERLKALEKKYADKEEIPRPKNWGGYLVKPMIIEFWQGRPNRLHDRIQYVWSDDDWHLNRVQP